VGWYALVHESNMNLNRTIPVVNSTIIATTIYEHLTNGANYDLFTTESANECDRVRTHSIYTHKWVVS